MLLLWVLLLLLLLLLLWCRRSCVLKQLPASWRSSHVREGVTLYSRIASRQLPGRESRDGKGGEEEDQQEGDEKEEVDLVGGIAPQ